MRNKVATVAATVLLASGAAFATASSASAAPAPPGGSWDHTWTTTDSPPGGTVYIEEHGDIVSLCDTDADGFTPRVEIRTQSSSGQYNFRYGLTASGGNGSCASARASDGGSHDLPENANILVDIWQGSTVGTFGSEHIYLNDN